MHDLISRHLPKPIVKSAKKMFFCISDHLEILLGRRERLTPPSRLMFIGPGDFKEIGNEFLGYFRDIAGLKSDETILDVGCGIGRMAVPLTGYLQNGRYEGFDIVSEGIDWCTKTITPRFPHFRFQLADVYNKAYHPQGRYKASEYRFPYQDSEFDFVFLTSVFTHMLPDEVARYFSEIARVLKPGGRCLITFFLLNDESLRFLENGKSTMDFLYCHEGYRTINDETHELVIAYDEKEVFELFRKKRITYYTAHTLWVMVWKKCIFELSGYHLCNQGMRIFLTFVTHKY